MDTTPNKQICKSAYHSRGNPFFTYADGKVALFTCIFIYMFFIKSGKRVSVIGDASFSGCRSHRLLNGGQ